MGLAEIYYKYNVEFADKRTNDWTLISSPIPFLLLSIAYLYFVLNFGPKYMKDKRPYSFKTFIYWYNIFQIIANALIIYHALDANWLSDGYLFCKKLDYSFDRNPYKITQIIWYTLCIKIIDYTETILYVLRKKNRQVSFLHLYHHVSTATLAWGCVKYFPNGHALTLIVMNCGIHVIMYIYYLLTSYGPEMQKILAPFKPMVTIAQMVQFVIMILYMSQSFIPGCPNTETASALVTTNMIINFIFFYNFYKRTYTSTKNKGN